MNTRRPDRNSLTEAKETAAGLPDMLVEARRVAATVLAGWHGRRTAGRGETFWQFRPFVTGEPAAAIDWRRSARDDHLYVREKEWEAAHTLWLWLDQSSSMDFRSRLSEVSKRRRATLLLLALTDMLASAGERVGLMGSGEPVLARNAAERIASTLATTAEGGGKPSISGLRRFTDLILIGDFLDPIDETNQMLDAVTRSGARAHIIQVVDPIEEMFPYSGRTEFRDPETGTTHIVSRAEQYRTEYQRELAALRGSLGDRCRRTDWTFIIHRTDRPPTEPLLAIHARLADRHSRFVDQTGGVAA